MTQDTRIALFLMVELVAAIRAKTLTSSSDGCLVGCKTLVSQ